MFLEIKTTYLTGQIKNFQSQCLFWLCIHRSNLNISPKGKSVTIGEVTFCIPISIFWIQIGQVWIWIILGEKLGHWLKSTKDVVNIFKWNSTQLSTFVLDGPPVFYFAVIYQNKTCTKIFIKLIYLSLFNIPVYLKYV